jgi:diaminopimelate epimerase
MNLKFSKMHGLGNDFMVIDGIRQKIRLNSQQIGRWADRHSGIGFDQLLLVEKAESENALFKYRIFNADGSEVAQCGNGARCFARFVRSQGLTDAHVIPVETQGGLLTLNMIDDTRVEVNMGIPDFEPATIPLATAQRQARYQLDIDGQNVTFSALAIGNPHAVITVDDVDTAALETLGPALESHPFFPQRVNVGFMQIIAPNEFRLRVFERGVGETQACGSGACAAMAAGRQLGLLDENATGLLRGGDLQLGWQGEGKPVMMTGDTAEVYEGEIKL